MSETPDLAEALLGFRVWYVDRRGGLVPSAFSACTWQPGINRAECHADIRGPAHPAPDPDCTCGLYAFHSPDSLPSRRYEVCVGAVAAWGNVELHATGFRAEFACVVALSRGPLSQRFSCWLSAAAERYDVALVDVGDLCAAGLEHARPLARETVRALWCGCERCRLGSATTRPRGRDSSRCSPAPARIERRRADPILLPASLAPEEPMIHSGEMPKVETRLINFLSCDVRRDQGLAALMRSTRLLMCIELIDLGAKLELAHGPVARELTVRMTAATGHALFSGQLDLPRAIALRRIELGGDRAQFGSVVSVLKRLFPRYRAYLAE